MTAEPSLWSYIANADAVVKTVILILVAASIASWTLIFQRLALFKRVRREMRVFEDEFWSGVSLADLFRRAGKNAKGMTAIFKAGYDEYQHLTATTQNNTELMRGVKRAMHISTQQQLEKLESNVSFLATVGSTSPYVGLFGTVWGIMSAFRALGSVQQASISMVAPGISEALIATAIGLFAAIPAVIAYNRFSTELDTIFQRYELFEEEFLVLLNRQV